MFIKNAQAILGLFWQT